MTQLGTITQIDGRHVLVQTRTFHAPIEDVWAAVTEPARLARWIGSWEGDPASGSVQFRMHLTSRVGEEVWLLELDLTHSQGVTTLRFAQPGITADNAGGVGPGWDYYLDRLVDAETGADPSLRAWADYESTGEHYTSQFQGQF